MRSVSSLLQGLGNVNYFFLSFSAISKFERITARMIEELSKSGTRQGWKLYEIGLGKEKGTL